MSVRVGTRVGTIKTLSDDRASVTWADRTFSDHKRTELEPVDDGRAGRDY